MVTFNAKDIFGATLGSLALLYQWKTNDTKQFADTVSSLGLTAVFSANPILTMISMIGFARAYQLDRKNKGLWSRTNEGVLTTGGYMALTAILPGPMAIRIGLGLVSSIILRTVYDRVENEFNKPMKELPVHKELEDVFEKIVDKSIPLMKHNFQEIFSKYKG